MNLNQKIQKAFDALNRLNREYENFAVSFSGGKDSTVVYYMCLELFGNNFDAFAVLSDTEFEETEQYIKEINSLEKNIKIWRYKNDGGPNDCCRTKKVDTFKKAVKPYKAWVSGLRRDEGVTRTALQYFEERDGLIKCNPLVEWSEKDVWRFLAIMNIPVNEAYRKGYRSLSCRLCSSLEKDDTEPERAGRWAGTEHAGKECGVHTQSLRK